MSIQQSLYQALTVLGSTADEVADRLHEMGFLGVQGDPAECPMSRYLSETLHCTVKVFTFSVEVLGVSFSVPTPCREFIELFDSGKWPLLQEEARHAPDCPNLKDHCTCS